MFGGMKWDQGYEILEVDTKRCDMWYIAITMFTKIGFISPTSQHYLKHDLLCTMIHIEIKFNNLWDRP